MFNLHKSKENYNKVMVRIRGSGRRRRKKEKRRKGEEGERGGGKERRRRKGDTNKNWRKKEKQWLPKHGQIHLLIFHYKLRKLQKIKFIVIC